MKSYDEPTVGLCICHVKEFYPVCPYATLKEINEWEIYKIKLQALQRTNSEKTEGY